jgi:hypothetical protein
VNRYLNRARPLAAFLAIALCSTVAAPPAAAAGPAPAPAPARPLAAAAEAAGAALPQSAVAQTPAPAATPAADSKPFFKSTKGVLALVLTAGALGYMGYSFSSDRVKSPQR